MSTDTTTQDSADQAAGEWPQTPIKGYLVDNYVEFIGKPSTPEPTLPLAVGLHAPAFEVDDLDDREPGVQTLVVPDLGDFEDVEVIEVHINKGDEVAIDDPLVTLETDKAAMDVPASHAGTIASVEVQVGDTVSTGDVVAIVAASEAAVEAALACGADEEAMDSLRSTLQRSELNSDEES